MKKLLLALTLASGSSLVAAAQGVFDDRGAFAAATGPNQVATFDDVPALTTAPFTSGGVLIEQHLSFGSPIVRDQSVGQPHSYWFPGAGSAPNFLDTVISFKATFPYDVRAVGFDFTCFFCSSGPSDKLSWELYSEGGSLVASGEAFYDFSGWTFSFTPFFGVTSDVAFRSLVVTRPSLGNWFADDLRFSEVTVPAPDTLAFNPAGVGQILYVPYFSTQEGNVTAISVVNTDTVNGKVLKVRFRGASNSDDVYDFQVFLSPGDVWTAGISKGADGRSQLATADKSCTLPASVNGSFITGRLPAAGGADETREGYVEILTMADIVKGADKSNQLALYTATKHVKGSAPCTASVMTALTHENASEYMAAPTTGIMANWTIINVAKVVAYSGDAAAIEARDADGMPIAGNLVYWDQRSTPLEDDEVASGTADPLIRDGAIAGARYDLPDLSTPYLPGNTCPFCQARALSDAIAVQEVAGEFYSEASVGAQTDWVISFPTRRYFAAVDYADDDTPVYNEEGNIYFNEDSTEMGNAANGGKAWQLCSVFGANALAFYDREEAPTVVDDIVISPGTPSKLSICGEVTVLGINAGASTATFGSVARANVSNGFKEGWGSLATPGADGLPMLVRQFTRVNNTQSNVYYGMSYPARIVTRGAPAPFVPTEE
jgi:hypothetical protein